MVVVLLPHPLLPVAAVEVVPLQAALLPWCQEQVTLSLLVVAVVAARLPQLAREKMGPHQPLMHRRWLPMVEQEGLVLQVLHQEMVVQEGLQEQVP